MKNIVSIILIFLFSCAFYMHGMTPNNNNLIEIVTKCAKGGSGLQKIEVKGMQQSEVDNMMQEVRETLAEVGNGAIQREQAQGLEADRIAEVAEKDAGYKNQNTLLFKIGSGQLSLGLYKRDLIESMNVILNIAADVLVYKRLNNLRINYLNDLILEKHAEIENLLLKIKENQKKWQQDYDNKSSVMKAFVNVEFERLRILKPLRDFLNKNCRVVGANPFKQDVFMALFTRWATEKLTNKLEDWLIVKGHLPSDTAPSPLGIEKSYTRDENGRLVEMDLPFLSLTRMLQWTRFIVTPFGWTNAIISSKDISSTIASASGYGLKFLNPQLSGAQMQPQSLLQSQQNIDRPSIFSRIKNFMVNKTHDFLTSQYIPNVIEFASLGFAAKFFDDMSNLSWGQYVIQNQDSLLRLLQEYRIEKESFGNVSRLKECEANIKQFIKNGHYIGNGVSMAKWFNTQALGYDRTQLVLQTPLLIFGAWKAISFYMGRR